MHSSLDCKRNFYKFSFANQEQACNGMYRSLKTLHTGGIFLVAHQVYLGVANHMGGTGCGPT